MEYNKKIDTHTSFTCFSGGHSFNVLKLCALHYGFDTRANFQPLVEQICAEFDLPIEYDEFSLTGGKRIIKQNIKHREPISPEELKNIQDDLNASIEPLKTFMHYQPNQKGAALILTSSSITDAVLLTIGLYPKLAALTKNP